MRASRNHRNVRTAASAHGASKSVRRRELAEPTQRACASVIEKLENRTLLSGTPGTPGYDPNSAGAPAVGAPLAQQMTSTDLEASTDTPVSGQTITFTATVSLFDPSQNTPLGGSLTVVVDNNTYGVYSLDSTGVVAINLSTLLVGDHEVDAFYGGDSLTTPSSAFYGITVGAANTTTNLVSSQNPAAVGQAVTFTATVSPVAPGAGVPTGSVQFMDGSTSLGTFALNASGHASFTTSALSIGSHSITASYVGDGNYNASASSALSQSVAKTSTVTTLLSSGNTVRGQSVTFTANVSASSGSATGTVQFMDGANLLGSGTLSGGVVTFTTSALAVGSHSVTAVYGGDASDNGSTSSALAEVVSKDATKTMLASSVSPSNFGNSMTFTATVSVLAPGAGAFGGSVMFMDGSTTLGSGTLSGGVATFSTGSLSVGTHSITAVYSADANDSGSTSIALSQVVNPLTVTSTTTLATSINPALVSTMVTSTATVHMSSGNASGNIVFKDGTTMLGSGAVNANGVATFSTTGLAAGHHTITAAYGGDTSSKSTSAALDQMVTTPVASKSKVSGVVFCDDNIDGKLQTTEKLLAGAVVKLLDSGGHVLATTTSAADGSYSFSDVVAGNYVIYVTSPANGYLAGPNGSTSHLTVVAGVNSAADNFAEVHVGSLSGLVWSDKNNNGKVDSNEQGLSGITINLSGTDCFGHSLSLSTTTNKNGEYNFANLNPGSYTIAEVQPKRNDFATGKAYVGTLGGTASDANTITSVKLPGGGEAGANYTFSELEKSVLKTIINVIKQELHALGHKN